MSGHSKWSKVKHQKATTDVAKGAAFTKASHAIMIAVREGGGNMDPDDNFRLRLAIEKARGVNMPKETIERAMAKAAGSGAGDIEQVIYEGYGPGGVAFVVEAATDNRNRTVSVIKNTFERHKGTLAAPGAVTFLFERAGVVTIDRGAMGADRMLAAVLEAGGDDIVIKDDVYEVYTPASALLQVKRKLEEQGMRIEHAALILKPTSCVEATPEVIEQVEALADELTGLDDVQQVYTNTA